MPYESAYKGFYTESPYNLEILKPRTAKRAWYQMSPLEKQRELGRQQTKLAGIPEVPPRMKRRRLKEAFQPMLNALKVFSVILNIPSTAVSSAVLQLMDGEPGFAGGQRKSRENFLFEIVDCIFGGVDDHLSVLFQFG